MDGLSIHGVSLFLGQLPLRKSWCFYFEADNRVYPVAYVPAKRLEDAKRLWAQFTAGIAYREEKGEL